MQAIEFKAILRNGTLTIPPEYSAQWEGKIIRVIVLDDAGNVAKPIEQFPKSPFNAISLQTQGFKFNRGEVQNDKCASINLTLR